MLRQPYPVVLVVVQEVYLETLLPALQEQPIKDSRVATLAVATAELQLPIKLPEVAVELEPPEIERYLEFLAQVALV
jgi:hypothetical protein